MQSTPTASAPDLESAVALHRRELHVHCYRMLGSFEDAEDAVQETFLRAHRKLDSFEGRSTLRAWLYRIATNVCLDALDRRPRRIPADRPQTTPPVEVPWLQPFPDELLDQLPAADAEPDAVVVAKETVELAYMVAIQHVPPRPRAVLILRDVLGWSARETAQALGMTLASANSALQRARAALRANLPEQRTEWSTADPTREERELLDRYVAATETGDRDGLVALLTEDARFAMPPQPGVWVGAETIVDAWVSGGFGDPEWGHMRCAITRANRQPAIAVWVKRAGDDTYRALAIDVLRIQEGRVADVVTFDAKVFEAFGLPEVLT